MTAPLAVWAAIGGSTAAAASQRVPASHASSKRSTAHVRGGAGACTSAASSAKRRTSCRSSGQHAPSHRGTSRVPRALRPRPRLTVKPVTSAGEAAAKHAGTIAKVLATPCQNTQLIPEAGNLALVRAAVLCLINTKRAQNGEEPLNPNPRLEQAAEAHGKEMLALNYFEHVSPTGLTPAQRIGTTGYIPSSEVGYVVGENLAWGTLTLATPQAIVNAWIASPEHLANILESKYLDTGVDVEPQVPEALAEGVAGALYTQEFGVIVR